MREFLSLALVPLLLLAGAAALIAAHLRAWRAAQRRELDSADLEFRRRQFRRRMQTSAVLALLALALLAGQWLVPWINSKLYAIIYWSAVLAVLGWVGLMAVVDLVATHYHYTRLRQHCQVEQAKLKVQLQRAQVSGNGRGKPPLEDDERPAGGNGQQPD
jgi:hypothetical protein